MVVEEKKKIQFDRLKSLVSVTGYRRRGLYQNSQGRYGWGVRDENIL